VIAARKIQHGYCGMIAIMAIEELAPFVKGTGLSHDDHKWRNDSKIF
jgi:hypothetical protein